MFDPKLVKGKKFVVVGDFMIDHYRFMRTKKLSPEAPVVVFEHVREDYRAGGAGNVASNLVSLGGKVQFFSIPSLLSRLGIGSFGRSGVVYRNWGVYIPFDYDMYEKKGTITVKERILTKRQQICRIDYQDDEMLGSEQAKGILEGYERCVADCDAVVMSDYEQGFMNYDMVKRMVWLAQRNEKMVVVDTKASDSTEKYTGVTALLPSHAELEMILGHEEPIAEAARQILLSAKAKMVGVTMGAKGIYALDRKDVEEDRKGTILPAHIWDEDEVADVTGAGDTVLAATAAALACGKDFKTALTFANEAAAQVVKKVGVVPVSVEQLCKDRGESNDKAS